ncbi:MAG: peptidase [Deltaproteobacteria bacterium RIFCSPLOWO2_12_FULL_60_19]|nr:MAG: peptidase [Deltaproteobacteria bacterium RIFCSPLOWO2_12_FULL_60_19]
MIKSFRHKGLQKFFFDGTKQGIQPKHAEKLADILDLLDAAGETRDMNFPGSDLHPLKGDLRGFWSVKVSGNWRIIFRFENGDASDVDYVDYH